LHQRRELEAVGERSGNKRPGFDRLLNDATARKINMIAAWSVDRLGRSLQDLVGFLNELQALGCHLYLHQQAIDTTRRMRRTTALSVTSGCKCPSN
jgi:DNA invertase Pin-like site-specific DNA recombinase